MVESADHGAEGGEQALLIVGRHPAEHPALDRRQRVASLFDQALPGRGQPGGADSADGGFSRSLDQTPDLEAAQHLTHGLRRHEGAPRELRVRLVGRSTELLGTRVLRDGQSVPP